jgi:hypothetical protein
MSGHGDEAALTATSGPLLANRPEPCIIGVEMMNETGAVVRLGQIENRISVGGNLSKVTPVHRCDGFREEGRSVRTYRSPAGNPPDSGLKTAICILIMWLLISTFGMPLPLNAEQRKGLGMWVWSSSSFSTPEARERLIHFCVKHRITHLDVHIKITNDSNKPILMDAEAFRDLIVLAGQHNITIAALRGNPKMFFSENHERTLRELRAIVAFSGMLPQETLLKGVKYDVEPYCTKEWKAGRMPVYPMIHDYLTLLRKARSVLDKDAPCLWLAADTPFWWDKDDFVLEFEGKRKRFNEHVQDLTDFITIMSYRRSSRKVLDCVENERRYAQRIKKVIFPALETVELKEDPHVSFWGVPTEELWKVVPELLEVAKGDPAIGGVMIHCYRSLFEKLSNDPLDKPDQMTGQ